MLYHTVSSASRKAKQKERNFLVYRRAPESRVNFLKISVFSGAPIVYN